MIEEYVSLSLFHRRCFASMGEFCPSYASIYKSVRRGEIAVARRRGLLVVLDEAAARATVERLASAMNGDYAPPETSAGRRQAA